MLAQAYPAAVLPSICCRICHILNTCAGEPDKGDVAEVRQVIIACP